MTDATVAQLRSVPLFAGSSDDELQALADHASRVTYGAGSALVTQGEPGEGLYVLLAGEGSVVIDGMAQGTVRTGDIVGEISMLSRGAATATVAARTEITALLLTPDDFAAAVRRHGDVALRVIRVLVERMRGDQIRLATYNATLLDYIDQVRHLTDAAAAVEAAIFQPAMLDGVIEREDELGRLARVFGKMAAEVEARERALRQEVQRLRITIDQKRADEQVAAITETDYFQELQRAADRLRSRGQGSG